MFKLFRTPRLFGWIYPRRLWGFSNSDKIYLTFDDGPNIELTQWILELLRKEDVKATFFCVGDNVRKHSMSYHSILAAGHQVGNHTMYHNNGDKTSFKEYLISVKEASKYIDSKLFRPPYGRLSMYKGVQIAKSYKIVMWNWLSYDYDQSVSISKIIANAQKELKGGDIIVLHDNVKSKERIQEILPAIISIVKSKGLQFDVISS